MKSKVHLESLVTYLMDKPPTAVKQILEKEQNILALPGIKS
jgi:hypothetical protein